MKDAPERIFIHNPSGQETKPCKCGADVEYVRADLSRSEGGEGELVSAFPLGTLQLLQRRIEKIRSCPCAMCNVCIEILCGDVIPIVDSVIARTPSQVEHWRGIAQDNALLLDEKYAASHLESEAEIKNAIELIRLGQHKTAILRLRSLLPPPPQSKQKG